MIQRSLLEGLADVPDPQPGTSDEFYTPRWYFGPIDEVHQFSVDVCATRESAKCARFYDYLQDGLAQDWAGETWWCNPPYSSIDPWVMKAWMERRARAGCMLLPAWTDRTWWQEEVEPFRDLPAGQVRPVRLKDGTWRTPEPRPWAALTVEFGPRIRFGIPGDPEGGSPAAKKIGAKIYPVLVTWRYQLVASAGGDRALSGIAA